MGNLGAPALYGEGGCGAGGFEVSRTGVTSLRSAVFATVKAVTAVDGAGVRPWVMARSICLDAVCPLHEAGDWWQERVIHMVMSGTDSVYFFNPVPTQPRRLRGIAISHIASMFSSFLSRFRMHTGRS